MSTSKIVADLCAVSQTVKIKRTFENIAYSVLVVKMFWQNIRNLAWKQMVNRLYL